MKTEDQWPKGPYTIRLNGENAVMEIITSKESPTPEQHVAYVGAGADAPVLALLAIAPELFESLKELHYAAGIVSNLHRTGTLKDEQRDHCMRALSKATDVLDKLERFSGSTKQNINSAMNFPYENYLDTHTAMWLAIKYMVAEINSYERMLVFGKLNLGKRIIHDEYEGIVVGIKYAYGSNNSQYFLVGITHKRKEQIRKGIQISKVMAGEPIAILHGDHFPQTHHNGYILLDVHEAEKYGIYGPVELNKQMPVDYDTTKSLFDLVFERGVSHQHAYSSILRK